MAIVIIQEPPPQMNAEMYDAVNAKLQVESGPPEGMMIHTAGQDDAGKWRIIDVYDSRESFERFSSERLGPAIEAVMRDFGVDPSSSSPRRSRSTTPVTCSSGRRLRTSMAARIRAGRRRC